jgi:hypothetical protein
MPRKLHPNTQNRIKKTPHADTSDLQFTDWIHHCTHFVVHAGRFPGKPVAVVSVFPSGPRCGLRLAASLLSGIPPGWGMLVKRESCSTNENGGLRGSRLNPDRYKAMTEQGLEENIRCGYE